MLQRGDGRLVISMLKVGAIGFGGGSALIPIIDDELVRRRGVLDQPTFTRHTVVASITPGALPVKLGGLAGLHASGPLLALLLALAVALPGTVLTVGLVAAVAHGGGALVDYVELASVGITVFIIALLVHYIDKVVRGEPSRMVVAALITAAAFLTTGLPDAVELAGSLVGQEWTVQLPTLSAVQLIGVALLGIAVRAMLRRKGVEAGGLDADQPTSSASDRRGFRAVMLLTSVGALAFLGALLAGGARALELVGLVLLSTLTSFGGGEAYVGVADGFFVGGGYVSSSAFYTQLVPIANALPGPILVKLAAGIGYVATAADAGPAAAAAVAACAAVVAVTSCTAVAVVVIGAYRRAHRSAVVRDIGIYILPVICGLLLTTSVAMLLAAAEVVEGVDRSPTPVLWTAVAAIALVVMIRGRRAVPDVVLLLVCGAASLAALGVR